MRVLIYGCSQLTAGIMPGLTENNFDIAVVGKERDCLEKLLAFPGVQVIWSTDPIMHDYLQDAGVDRVDLFLAMSTDDHENLLTSQIAKELFNVPRVVCHLANTELQRFYSSLGLNVVGYSIVLLQEVIEAIGTWSTRGQGGAEPCS